MNSENYDSSIRVTIPFVEQKLGHTVIFDSPMEADGVLYIDPINIFQSIKNSPKPSWEDWLGEFLKAIENDLNLAHDGIDH